MRRSLRGGFRFVSVEARQLDATSCPALDLLRLLEQKGAKVSYHDPHVPELRLDGASHTSSPPVDLLGKPDCAVIVTNRSSLDTAIIVERAPLVIGARNATQNSCSDRIQKL